MNIKDARAVYKFLRADQPEWQPTLLKIMPGFWCVDGIHPITGRQARWIPSRKDWVVGARMRSNTPITPEQVTIGGSKDD